jgi:hypothetical protein
VAGVTTRLLHHFSAESQGALTFNASRGSHSKAVHYNATLSPWPPKERYQVEKLVSVVSWIGVLASAVSEYGFDVDFSLAPSLWFAVAVFAFVAAAHNVSYGTAARSPVGVRARQPDWNCRAGTPTLCLSTSWVPAVRVSNSSVHGHPISENSVVPRVSLRAPVRGAATVSATVTDSDTVPAVSFLSPAATRVPLWSDDQIAGTLGRQARHVYTTSHPSEARLPNTRPSTMIAIMSRSFVDALAGLLLGRQRTANGSIARVAATSGSSTRNASPAPFTSTVALYHFVVMQRVGDNP